MSPLKEQLNVSIEALMHASLTMSKVYQEQEDTSPYRLIRNQMLALKNAISAEELNVLIGGEVKVGKSSLLNCILGKDLLSVAEEVCTNVPTKIKYGDKERYIVYFNEDENGECVSPKEIRPEEIPEYTSEKLNIRNEKNVEYLEIQINSDYLKNGLAFIDTPGLGALDPRHAQATMRIATKAHIILFLGSSDKQLTRSEIESLKTLIELSKCDFITHILTHSDKNRPDTILAENKEILTKELPNKRINYIKISSKYYRDYLKYKDIDDLKDSGYEGLFEYIREVNSSAKKMLMDIYIKRIYSMALSLKQMIDHAKSIIENPSKVENELDDLNLAQTKILEIEKKIEYWDEQLQKESIDLNSEMSYYLNNKNSEIVKKITDKVQDDYYLDPKKMSGYLNGQIQLLQNGLESTYSSKIQEIYSAIERNMGLDQIRDVVMGIKCDEINNKVELDIPQNNMIDSLNMGRNIAGGAFLGAATVSALASTKLGGVVGAKIGFWIGSVIPGFGNMAGTTIGAILGGLAGFVTAIFTTKKAKRDKMVSECTKNLALFINNVKIKMQGTISKTFFVIRKDVSNYLKSLKSECEAKIRIYRNLAHNLRTNYNLVKDSSQVVDYICENLKQNK